jgi:hypothetical protein
VGADLSGGDPGSVPDALSGRAGVAHPDFS